MKKFAAAILINALLISMPAYSAFFGNIPQKTLQIARETQSNNYFSAPQSKIVRVAIGDQNFQNMNMKLLQFMEQVNLKFIIMRII